MRVYAHAANGGMLPRSSRGVQGHIIGAGSHRRDDRDERDSIPPLVRAALDNLREVAGQVMEGDADAETKVVELLVRAAQEMKRNS